MLIRATGIVGSAVLFLSGAGLSVAQDAPAFALEAYPELPATTDDQSAALPASQLAYDVINQISAGHISLQAFSAQPTAVGHMGNGARFEFRVADTASPGLAGRLFDPASDIDPAVFLPDQERRTSLALDYITAYESFGGEAGLDLALEPRAGVSFGPEGSGVAAGAEVRLGQFLEPRGERPRWYMFAGAERQALLYDPRDGWNARNAMSLESYAVVGDAQAGVAFRLGEQDISFAYVRRERSTLVGMDGYEATDDFAAFSLSRRW